MACNHSFVINHKCSVESSLLMFLSLSLAPSLTFSTWGATVRMIQSMPGSTTGGSHSSHVGIPLSLSRMGRSMVPIAGWVGRLGAVFMPYVPNQPWWGPAGHLGSCLAVMIQPRCCCFWILYVGSCYFIQLWHIMCQCMWMLGECLTCYSSQCGNSYCIHK